MSSDNLYLGPYLLGPNDTPENGIYAGDARVLAEAIPDGSVGIIITSPPYNVKLNYVGYDDNISHEDFLEFNRQWLVSAYRIAQDSCRLYAVVGDHMLWWFRELAEGAGWTYAQKLTWCKPNFTAGPKISPDWNFMSEDILLFRKGKRTPMLDGRLHTTTHNWFVEAVPQSNYKEGRIHPAQWPVSLPLRILARSPGDPVLDLFAGSGSALVAAKMLRRPFIGFELVASVADLARQRIAQTQPPLFVPEPEQLPLDC